jgi:hypothetical protein
VAPTSTALARSRGREGRKRALGGAAAAPRRASGGPPPCSAFTRTEAALVARLRTPRAVQRWLRGLPYNHEKGGETLRSFRGVVRDGTAHCLEAALAAAVILEQHGHAPLLISFESIDKLDHVIYAFRRDGRWGAVARSRDPGLHGRKPVFGTARELAASFMDAYVDLTGRVTGFAVADLRELAPYDWRLSPRNVRKVERWLVDYPHRPLGMSDARYRRLHERYRRYKARYPDRKPVYYDDRHTWL